MSIDERRMIHRNGLLCLYDSGLRLHERALMDLRIKLVQIDEATNPDEYKQTLSEIKRIKKKLQFIRLHVKAERLHSQYDDEYRGVSSDVY